MFWLDQNKNSKSDNALKNSGFTIVEMSIVVVIIAFLLAGILGGKTLIRNSELVDISTKTEMIKSHFSRFETKYQALPGDFTQANTYWTGTQNGDGNTKISGAESTNAWQHLSKAKISKEKYNGSTNPNGPVGNSKFVVKYDTHYFKKGNLINLSKGGTGGAVLSPFEASSLDTKIDDGKPGQGNIIAKNGDGTSGCVDTQTISGNDNTNANYQLDGDNIKCQMYFWLNKSPQKRCSVAGQAYSEEYGGCIPVCDDGYNYDGSTCVCISGVFDISGACTTTSCTPPKVAGVDGVCRCPDATPLWDGSTCVACTGDRSYDAGTDSCVCPAGETYNSSADTCDAAPTCVLTSTETSNDYGDAGHDLEHWDGEHGEILVHKLTYGDTVCVQGGNPSDEFSQSSCACGSDAAEVDDEECISPNIQDGNGVCHAPCQDGSSWDEDLQECVCPDNGNYTSTNTCVICADGEHWESATETCETCDAGLGLTWDASQNQCVTICVGDYIWSGSECACPDGQDSNGANSCITCPANSDWEGDTCVCDVSLGLTMNDSNSCVSICTGGQEWTGTECSCPEGSNLNTDTSTCVTCAATEDWDEASLTCINKCGVDSSYEWNTSSETCVCPSGQFDNGSECVSCGFTEQWNATTQECESLCTGDNTVAGYYQNNTNSPHVQCYCKSGTQGIEISGVVGDNSFHYRWITSSKALVNYNLVCGAASGFCSKVYEEGDTSYYKRQSTDSYYFAVKSDSCSQLESDGSGIVLSGGTLNTDTCLCDGGDICYERASDGGLTAIDCPDHEICINGSEWDTDISACACPAGTYDYRAYTNYLNNVYYPAMGSSSSVAVPEELTCINSPCGSRPLYQFENGGYECGCPAGQDAKFRSNYWNANNKYWHYSVENLHMRYQTSTYVRQCVTCGEGNEFDRDLNQCVETCRADEVLDNKVCVCPEGTYDSGDACVAICDGDDCSCGEGQWVEATASAPFVTCSSCPEDATSNGTTCSCPVDTIFDEDNSICRPECTGGTHWDQGASSCVCDEGDNFNTDTSECQTCEADDEWDTDNNTCNARCDTGANEEWNGAACICSVGYEYNNFMESCVLKSNGSCRSLGSIDYDGGTFTVYSDGGRTVMANGSSCEDLFKSGGAPGAGSILYVGGSVDSSNCVCNTSTVCSARASNGSLTPLTPSECIVPCHSNLEWDGNDCTCPSGTELSGGSCISVCKGSSTWDSTECTCPEGKTYDGLNCECDSGTFENGAGECIACASGEEWDLGALECISTCKADDSTWDGVSCTCPEGKTYNSSAETCDCNDGTNMDNAGECITCVSGEEWDTATKTCLSVCVVDGQSWNGSSCQCASPRWYSADRNICSCNWGEVWDGGACAACSGGEHFDGSSWTCQTCPGTSTWNGGACTCEWDEDFDTDLQTCVKKCGETQTWSGSECQCPEGTNILGKECITCAVGENWDGAACVSPINGCWAEYIIGKNRYLLHNGTSQQGPMWFSSIDNSAESGCTYANTNTCSTRFFFNNINQYVISTTCPFRAAAENVQTCPTGKLHNKWGNCNVSTGCGGGEEYNAYNGTGGSCQPATCPSSWIKEASTGICRQSCPSNTIWNGFACGCEYDQSYDDDSGLCVNN